MAVLASYAEGGKKKNIRIDKIDLEMLASKYYKRCDIKSDQPQYSLVLVKYCYVASTFLSNVFIFLYKLSCCKIDILFDDICNE